MGMFIIYISKTIHKVWVYLYCTLLYLGVIIVAIYYRLGVFGFISIGNDTMTGNYGITHDLF